jgi:hypothetical protein
MTSQSTNVGARNQKKNCVGKGMRMGLDESQKQKFRDWLQSKSARPTCASCDRNEWGAGEIISAPILDDEGNVVGNSHVPMVQLICTNCCYVMLYAAVPMGLTQE